jgi:hypothetical protein
MYESSKQAQQHQKRHNSSILTQNERNFLPGGVISTFNRRNDCVLLAKHKARCIKHRNKPHNAPNAIIYRFRRKMTVISFPGEIFRRLNAPMTVFYPQNIMHAVWIVATGPTTRQTLSFVAFNEKRPQFSSRWRYFYVFMPKLLYFTRRT